ncbi:MAG TPA: hypothetical protein PKE33_14370 [Kiritimatiellia bacterium]|nr:hypothetical protein [Kiritimatiellia bacterium]
MHAPDTYRFFDQRVRLNAPPSVRAAWNLLYGAMADPDLAPATREHRVDVAADGVLTVNGQMRDPGPGSIMARLQEVVQNDILTSVTSHLLWHGAVWRIDGRALLVVADSGCGKTTLSLRHRVCGGEVWSDEAGGWDLATGGLRAWPRAMAVRPDSLALAGMAGHPPPTLDLDERKHIVPVDAASGETSLALAGVALLEWPVDPSHRESEGWHTAEFEVPGRDRGWINAWRVQCPSWQVLPHPDGPPWWRIRCPTPVSAGQVAAALHGVGARYGGWHDGPRRRPDFQQSPVMSALAGADRVSALLAHTLNGRALSMVIGEGRVWAAARLAMVDVPGCRIVPGELDATYRMLVEAVRR